MFKFRKKREGVEKGIDMERWNEHFMKLLEGTKDRIVLEEEENKQREAKKKEEEE